MVWLCRAIFIAYWWLRSDSGGSYRAKGLVVKKEKKEDRKGKKIGCIFKILFLKHLSFFISMIGFLAPKSL